MTHPATDNPLLRPWSGPFQTPPFGDIRPEHFRPAFDVAIAERRAEVEAIAGSPDEPSFANTIEALERSAETLDRVRAVFHNLTGADTNDELQAIEREMSPLLARAGNEIYLNEKLFARISRLWEGRASLGLNAEQSRVLERYHTIFTRRGAGLAAKEKRRLAQISERLAELGTAFGQNVLADEKEYRLILEGEADLAGLPDWVRAAAGQAAEDRGLKGKYAVTLSRSSIEPFLTTSSRRDLREKAFQAWINRGQSGGKTDNRAVIAETLKLRDERAGLLGYQSFAHFRLADTMAKTPEAVTQLLDEVWVAGRARARREANDLQALIASDGGNFKLAASDWRYYSERVRKQRFDFDEAELKSYLQLDKMIEASFYTAGRLFGLKFAERFDVPTYHPDVRVFEVTGTDGRHVGLFLADYFACSSKRSGAWMSGFREQQRLDGEVRPIIVNVMNFNKAPPGQPVLLSFDDARTLFHEFGHALHGLLSDVTYPLISGTSVARDFVELPSQLYEHWLEQREVLGKFAVHAETGAPMPEALLQKVLAARNFNQGFATVEYTSSALVDLDLHLRKDVSDIDVIGAEREVLDRIEMPDEIVMRHRTPHFQHVFAGEGYSAGYYSYLWSEVLDADAFAAFQETGDVFDPATARRLHDYVYSAGYRRDPVEAYVAFRGRMPDTGPLLKKRGLEKAGG